MIISGTTDIIAHIGYPTHSFKAPMIYNPWFEHAGVDAVVVPMGCLADDFPAFFRSVFTLSNIRGALITMPHKQRVLALLDEISVTARVAGACNAVRRAPDGRLLGDQFDGEGFVRGVVRKGFVLSDARALVVGSGGVGSAIAASLAAAGIGALQLHDLNTAAAESLAERLRQHCPAVEVRAGGCDPAGFDLVINATPLGMKADDPLPFDVTRLKPGAWVGEVVLTQAMTPLLQAAARRAHPVMQGTDMLFEMIPAYLEFFDLPVASAERLRELAQLPG